MMALFATTPPRMALTVLTVGLVVLILLGAPIGVTMAVLPLAYILVTGELPLSTVPYQMYEALSHAPLIAVPFFMLTGHLMNSAQITERLLLLSRELVGRIRGGLAQVNVLASMIFAGMSGSAVADTSAVGGLLIPAMKKSGYPAAFAAALTAVASTIGGIVPPSIVMVLLASTMGYSVGALFAAGILPGILVGVLLMIVAYGYAVKRGYERYQAPFTFRGLWKAFLSAWTALVIPTVIVTGIVFGVFSATEAGAITVVVALLIGAVVYRTLTLKSFAATLARSVKITSSVFIILAASGPFSWLLNRIGALQGLEDWFMGFADSPALFAVVLVFFILAVGTVIETVPALIVLAPTLIKVCVAAGFHEIQASVVLVVGFVVGAVSPPVGIIYFTAASIAEESLEAVGLAMIPFMLAEVAVMFLILYVPGLTLLIPRLLGFLHG